MEALRRVSYWDDLEKDRELGLEEDEERTKAKFDLKSWALMEEISWRQKSRETWLKSRVRPISDHFPILLDSDRIRTGPSPFWFELMWLKYEGFKEILKGWWQSLVFHGSYSFILAAKLKGLKGILKVWNREFFGRVEANCWRLYGECLTGTILRRIGS